MTVFEDFGDMGSTTVVVASRASANIYGENSWSTSGSTFTARLVREPVAVRDQQGTLVEAEATVWLLSTGSSGVKATDRVTLGDGSTPEIMRVMRYPDESGHHHVKLLLGH